MSKRYNLIGEKSGKLIVVEKLDERDKFNQIQWLCNCDCGGKIILSTTRITHQSVKSCGCIYHPQGEKNPKWTGYKEIPGKFFYNIKKGAELRGLNFNITIEEIWDLFLKQNKKCAITGWDLSIWKNSKKTMEGNASLDRIDSSIGYDIDNVQWVDKEINRFKNHYPMDEFLEMCKMVVEYKCV
jgi:hypothetical protein